MRTSIAVLLIATAAYASPVYAPLPPDAYSAKTIAIVNHTGRQQVLDKAYEELAKWGRFSVIQDPKVADLVLVIEVEQHESGATANTYGSTTTVSSNTVTHITTSFILKGQSEPFFSETERAALFRKSATQRGIDELRKRLEEKAKP